MAKSVLFAVFFRYARRIYGQFNRKYGGLGVPHTDLANPRYGGWLHPCAAGAGLHGAPPPARLPLLPVEWGGGGVRCRGRVPCKGPVPRCTSAVCCDAHRPRAALHAVLHNGHVLCCMLCPARAACRTACCAAQGPHAALRNGRVLRCMLCCATAMYCAVLCCGRAACGAAQGLRTVLHMRCVLRNSGGGHVHVRLGASGLGWGGREGACCVHACILAAVLPRESCVVSASLCPIPGTLPTRTHNYTNTYTQ